VDTIVRYLLTGYGERVESDLPGARACALRSDVENLFEIERFAARHFIEVLLAELVLRVLILRPLALVYTPVRQWTPLSAIRSTQTNADGAAITVMRVTKRVRSTHVYFGFSNKPKMQRHAPCHRGRRAGTRYAASIVNR
jgi:hypothetical protein